MGTESKRFTAAVPNSWQAVRYKPGQAPGSSFVPGYFGFGSGLSSYPTAFLGILVEDAPGYQNLPVPGRHTSRRPAVLPSVMRPARVSLLIRGPTMSTGCC